MTRLPLRSIERLDALGGDQAVGADSEAIREGLEFRSGSIARMVSTIEELPKLATPAATCCNERALEPAVTMSNVTSFFFEEALFPRHNGGPNRNADTNHDRGR